MEFPILSLGTSKLRPSQGFLWGLFLGVNMDSFSVVQNGKLKNVQDLINPKQIY